MLLTVIFLISCIITARLLEKKNMRVATVAYSVMFIILLYVLLLVIDFAPTNQAFTKLLGEEVYLETKEALLYALNSQGYGTCICFALFLTLFLQLTTALTIAVTGILHLLTGKKEGFFQKREKQLSPRKPREVCLNNHINLLYCRMLN